MWYSQDPQPCAGNPQTEGQSQLQGFFPRREVTKPHLRGPTLRVLHWEDKPQNTQGQQGSLSAEAEGCSRDSSLKGLTQNVTCSKTQGRSSNLKARELILRLVDKKSGPEEEEVQGS